MRFPVVPIVSIIVALLGFVYITQSGELFPGVLVVGIAAIGFRVGLSTHFRRAALRKAALENYSHGADGASTEEEFVARHIERREWSDTKKTLVGLVIAILGAAVYLYVSVH